MFLYFTVYSTEIREDFGEDCQITVETVEHFVRMSSVENSWPMRSHRSENSSKKLPKLAKTCLNPLQLKLLSKQQPQKNKNKETMVVIVV